jgi:hypothetical protein
MLDQIAQASRHLHSVATSDACWKLHSTSLAEAYGLGPRERECMMDGFGHGLLPDYNGPPLRMPYLTPWTLKEWANRRHVHVMAQLMKPFEERERDAHCGSSHSDSALSKVTDDGIQYRCYLTCQSNLKLTDRRTDLWTTQTFPITCCGVQCTTRAEFEAHAKTVRHFEKMQGQRGAGELYPSLIDPRLRDGEAAFAALPRREQYLRLERFTTMVEREIMAFDNESEWDQADWRHLQRLSEGAIEHMQNILATDSDLGYLEAECRMDCQPAAIGHHIVASVLEAFGNSGMYEEGRVPYASPRELLTAGLAGCDPCGGSCSERHFVTGLSELFDWYYS